jgi:hypothetical protein
MSEARQVVEDALRRNPDDADAGRMLADLRAHGAGTGS